MDSGVLKEFLVRLGFDVREDQLKKFTKGIDNASKMVGKFALGLEAMATAAEVAVVKVSTQFENLYYASQRLEDSVEDIRGYGFALGQVGASGKAGLQAMENIAEFLRSNPGGNRLFQAWGIDLKYVNGQAQVTSQTMEQLGATFRKMPYFQAKQYAGLLGIDPNTLQAMIRGTSEEQKKASEIFRRMGVDQDAAALASKNFMNDFRELTLVLTVGLDKIILAVQPTFDAITKGLESLDAATGGWSTALIVLGGLLLPLLTVVDPIVIAVAALAAGIVWVVATFSDWRKGLTDVGGGLSDIWAALQPVVAAVEGFGIVLAKVFGPALGPLLNAAFTLLADGLHIVAGVIRLIIDLLTLNWTKAWADNKALGLDMAKALTDAFQGLWNIVKGVGGGIRDAWNWMHGRGGNATTPGAAPGAAVNDNTVQGGINAGAAVASKVASQIQQFFEAHGFTRAQARGVTAGAGAESRFNPNAVNPTSGAFGIGQWLGRRKTELFRRYGRNPTLDQQLEFMISELSGNEGAAGSAIKGQSTSAGALSAYINKFMRPGPGAAGDMQRGLSYLGSAPTLASGGAAANGNKDVQIAQTTTIHVTGAGDATSTAKAVAAEQARVNDGMVRNLKVAAS